MKLKCTVFILLVHWLAFCAPAGAAGFMAAALTNTQLRAAPVPVSGPLTDSQLRASAVPVSATQVPPTSGGLSAHHRITTTSPNDYTVKSTAGQVFGWSVFNNGADAIKVSFHDISTTPTQGTTAIVFSVFVPAGGKSETFIGSFGIAFSAGIGISVTNVNTSPSSVGVLDNSVNDPLAGQASVDIFYK